MVAEAIDVQIRDQRGARCGGERDRAPRSGRRTQNGRRQRCCRFSGDYFCLQKVVQYHLRRTTARMESRAGCCTMKGQLTIYHCFNPVSFFLHGLPSYIIVHTCWQGRWWFIKCWKVPQRKWRGTGWCRLLTAGVDKLLWGHMNMYRLGQQEEGLLSSCTRTRISYILNLCVSVRTSAL